MPPQVQVFDFTQVSLDLFRSNFSKVDFSNFLLGSGLRQ